MGLSETIVAAMIGAIATVTTALFQIFSSFKNRKVETKPRRGSTMRSILAVLALMVASAVGGFLYSELLKQRGNEELRAMHLELRELKDLTRSVRITEPPPAAVTAEPLHVASPAEFEPAARQAESIVYVPACRRVAEEGMGVALCSEADALRIALCGSVPSYARIDGIELFAQPDALQRPWIEHRAALDQDLGGARFVGKTFEYAQGTEQKAVCVNFTQWSSEHSHIARIVVSYGFGMPAPLPATDAAVSTLPAVIAADALPELSQPARFVTSTKP